MAAGKGTRMKSEKAKCVHKIYGREMAPCALLLFILFRAKDNSSISKQ